MACVGNNFPNINHQHWLDGLGLNLDKLPEADRKGFIHLAHIRINIIAAQKVCIGEPNWSRVYQDAAPAIRAMRSEYKKHEVDAAKQTLTQQQQEIANAAPKKFNYQFPHKDKLTACLDSKRGTEYLKEKNLHVQLSDTFAARVVPPEGVAMGVLLDLHDWNEKQKLNPMTMRIIHLTVKDNLQDCSEKVPAN